MLWQRKSFVCAVAFACRSSRLRGDFSTTSSQFIVSVCMKRRRRTSPVTIRPRPQPQSLCWHRIPVTRRRQRPRRSAVRWKPEAEMCQRPDSRRRKVSQSITRLRGRLPPSRISAVESWCQCRRCCRAPRRRPTRCCVNRCRSAMRRALSAQRHQLYHGQ